MSGWLRAVLLALTLMVGSWALLVLLARRLPPGLLPDLASILPACVTRQVPHDILAAAWPGELRMLEGLLGDRTPGRQRSN